MAQDVAHIKDGAVYIDTPGTPVYIKTADVCRITGKSDQWIGRLANEGVLNKTKVGRFGMFEIGETFGTYLGLIESRTQEQTDKDKKIDFARRSAEASIKASKARIAGFDADERAGIMHRSEDVAAMTEDLVYEIRGALLALPGRLAVEVVNAKDSAEAAVIIRREVYQLMDELSKYKYDPEKYEERLRERLKLEAKGNADDE